MPASSVKAGAWPEAVIFDLDGTLVDSVADIAAALNVVLLDNGLAAHSLAEVRSMVGGGVPKLIERAWAAQGRRIGARALARTTEDFLAVYGPHAADRTTLYAGAADLLERLDAAGARLGVCTNKPEAISRFILDSLGVLGRFGAVVGGDSGLPKKPDPAMVREALVRLGATPQTAVVIGDSGADVGAARAAGVAVLAVSYGYTRTPPAELGADAVIASLADAPAAIAGLANGRLTAH